MNEEVFDVLLRKYLSNDITNQELDQFLLLVEECDDLVLENKLQQLSDIDFKHYKLSKRRDAILQNVILSQESKPSFYSKITKNIYYQIAGIAAAIILFSTIVFSDKVHFSSTIDSEEGDIIVTNEGIRVSQGELMPYVSLPDGTGHIQLGHVSLSVDSNGGLSYAVDETISQKTEPIIIETPKGKNVFLKLIDGTEVWLNAGSKIKFNPLLNSSNREVSLTGEAFFEVAKDAKRPFVVSTSKSKVEVLGTAFNISAFKEDQYETTTLVHGKIKLSNEVSNAILLPNMQFIQSTKNNEGVLIENVDVDEFLAWRLDSFDFNKKNIKEVLQLLGRWYDIKSVEFNKLNNDTFTGTFKRSRSLRSVLDQLELVSNYEFDIIKGQIIVK